MGSIVRYLILSTLFLSFVASAKPAERRVTGTFIQMQEFMLTLGEKEWKAELDSMRELGLDTIVLQWLRYDQTRFFPANAPGNDPAEMILAYADKHGMKVLLGLHFLSAWWKQWDDAEFLASLTRRNTEFAAKVWERYGKHKSFAGWYLPFELADIDFDDEELRRLRKFFRDLSDACKKPGKNKLPVAKSIFFKRKLKPATVETIYTRLLEGAGIDVLLVQDGVGTNGWEGGVKDITVPYLKAFVRVANKIRAEPWLTLEAFRSVRNKDGATTFAPAFAEQISEQLDSESWLFDKTIVFDFFHYLSPHRGEEQKGVFEAMKKEAADTP